MVATVATFTKDGSTEIQGRERVGRATLDITTYGTTATARTKSPKDFGLNRIKFVRVSHNGARFHPTWVKSGDNVVFALFGDKAVAAAGGAFEEVPDATVITTPQGKLHIEAVGV